VDPEWTFLVKPSFPFFPRFRGNVRATIRAPLGRNAPNPRVVCGTPEFSFQNAPTLVFSYSRDLTDLRSYFTRNLSVKLYSSTV